MEKKRESPNGSGLSLEKTLIQCENMSTHGIVWIVIELSFQPGEIAGGHADCALLRKELLGVMGIFP